MSAVDHLLVPMRLDALRVAGKELVAVRRSPDFTRLPYFNPRDKVDVNADTAFLAETIVPQPFANADVELGPGLHLHWALPDGLTKGHYDPEADTIVFPELPTRWLVVRRTGAAGSRSFDRGWVVESDYLAPPGVNRRGIAIDIPFGDDRTGQPYRHLGRVLPLDSWPSPDSPARLESLTAVGFGDPGFAAYYPSCFSLFGFWDADPPADLKTVEYLVLGWYPDGDRDIRDPLRRLARTAGFGPEAVEEQFDWVLDPASAGSAMPERILCYSLIEFAPARNHADDRVAPIAVTVANSPGEALAARLARNIVERQRPTLADPTGARANVELQLEALDVGAELDEDGLSLRTQVEALQHRARFGPVDSSTTWRIRVEDSQAAPTGDPAAPVRRTPLSVAVVSALDELNDLQNRYDADTRTIGGLQTRLFADWYKYMISMYPPDAGPRTYPEPDRIKFFIEQGDLADLQALMARTGRLDLNADGGAPTVADGDADSLAANVVAALQRLDTALAAFESGLSTEERDRYVFAIETVPGGRFWQATNPVVLLSGDGAKPTPRHGQDGTLQCRTLSADLTTAAGATAAAQVMDGTIPADDQGYNRWRAQPWNPVVLEWKVQLFSLTERSELHGGGERYSHSYITNNFESPILSPELETKPGRGKLVPDPSVYVGSTILTGHAADLLRSEIIDRLVRKSATVTAELAKAGVTDPEAQAAALDDPSTVADLIRALPARSVDDPNYTLLRSLEELVAMPSVSQELGGFNEALIQRKDTIELPVDDPINFESYRSVSRRQISQALVGGGRVAPSPLNAFNPIRAGSLKVMDLRLIDTFGQLRRVDIDDLTTSTAMATPGAEHLVRLSPRLAQPARLSFRWQAATAGGPDDGLNEATSNTVAVESSADKMPICGWLLPNVLARSLVVHDAAGQALGSFVAGDVAATWRPPAGGSPAPTVADITNPHLRRVVEFLQRGIKTEGGEFINNFMAVLEDGIDNIGGADHRGAQGAAALMGRPLAVVRASVDLQLLGVPAVDHTWEVFTRDLDRATRSTADFTKVRFPVRIGEYGHLGDGLIGYWLERRDAAGHIDFVGSDGGPGRFYAPQSDYIDTETIETRFEAMSDGAINFHQAIDDPPQMLTLLMDPRYKVHATVGILPRKVLDIPMDQYTEALDGIEVDFLHAPLLTPAGRLELPLRPIPDFDWTWVELDGDGAWRELYPKKRVAAVDVTAGWDQMMAGAVPIAGSNPEAEQTAPQNGAPPDGAALWTTLTDPLVGWVRPLLFNVAGLAATEPEYVIAAAEDTGRVDKLPAPFTGAEAVVIELLDRVGVGVDPIDTRARYGLTNELRDGWLKLRRRATTPR